MEGAQSTICHWLFEAEYATDDPKEWRRVARSRGTISRSAPQCDLFPFAWRVETWLLLQGRDIEQASLYATVSCCWRWLKVHGSDPGEFYP
jgi:hypothetical protein